MSNNRSYWWERLLDIAVLCAIFGGMFVNIESILEWLERGTDKALNLLSSLSNVFLQALAFVFIGAVALLVIGGLVYLLIMIITWPVRVIRHRKSQIGQLEKNLKLADRNIHLAYAERKISLGKAKEKRRQARKWRADLNPEQYDQHTIQFMTKKSERREKQALQDEEKVQSYERYIKELRRRKNGIAKRIEVLQDTVDDESWDEASAAYDATIFSFEEYCRLYEEVIADAEEELGNRMEAIDGKTTFEFNLDKVDEQDESLILPKLNLDEEQRELLNKYN